MNTIKIEMSLVAKGWRSSILSSLCLHCPLDTVAGCCKIKTTLFWGDLGYIASNHLELLPELLNKAATQVLSHGIVFELVNDKCTFLTQKGCYLPDPAKSLMCRTFICRGLGLENHPIGSRWLVAMERLSREERKRNLELANKLINLKLKHPLDLLDKKNDFLAIYNSIFDGDPEWFTATVGEKSLEISISKNELFAWELQ